MKKHDDKPHSYSQPSSQSMIFHAASTKITLNRAITHQNKGGPQPAFWRH
jgi:hypothetical protein